MASIWLELVTFLLGIPIAGLFLYYLFNVDGAFTRQVSYATATTRLHRGEKYEG